MLELPAWWYEDDEWRGFVLCGHRTDLLDQHVFATYLAGFNHRPEVARKAVVRSWQAVESDSGAG